MEYVLKCVPFFNKYYMKYIRTYESFDFTSDVYLFNNEPVKIVHVDYITGSEISVSYKNQDGTIQLFNDTIKDFEETFTPIDSKEFKLNVKKKVDPNATYDVIYKVNNKKISTLRYNLPIKLAHSLKAMYSKDPIYKLGEIKVELNK